MKRPGYKYLLALLDWLTLNISFSIALGLRQVAESAEPEFMPVFHNTEALFFAAYALGVVAIFQLNNLYKINVFLTIVDHTVRLAFSLVYAMFGLAIISFFTKSSIVTDSRLVIFGFLAISGILFFVLRVMVFRSLFHVLAKKSLYIRRALVIGAGKTGKLLAANISMTNPYGLRVVGFVDDDLDAGTNIFLGTKVVGKISSTIELVRKHRISEVIIALDDVTHDKLLELLDTFRRSKVSVKVASPLYDIIPERIFTERYGAIPVTGITSVNKGWLYWTIKRGFDLVLTIIGLVLLSPFLAFVALCIKLDSSGPVLYTQTRIGKNGKPFKFYKFRSMYLDSDKDDARKHKVATFIRSKTRHNGSTKIVDDSKVTKVGRVIRKMSIDELPQLINVLKGEMTLVGPRPCLPYEWETYENWHKRRLTTVPGCTGIWQVNGRSEVGFDDMVILDLYYIDNASILLDLQLMIKTIPVMLFGKGAK